MGGYKEHKIFDMLARKSVIIKYFISITLIFIITIIFLMQVIMKNKTRDIVYTENSEVDYKVYLKENDFFEGSYLTKDNQYIASLINYIETDFEYQLETTEKDIDYTYTYKIIAETSVVDKTNNNSLYNSVEELVEEKEYKANSNSKLEIKENIIVDYNKYNDLINKFVDTYDLDNNVASVNIKMFVKINDNINENCNNYVPAISLNIPLTTKTIAIDIESNLVNENDISVCENVEKDKYTFGTVILFIIDIILVVKLLIFIKDTKDEESIYNMRLRRIMSNYGSYVQKLNNEFNFEEYQILEIRSFEDLLQVRDTINKPILMTERPVVKETYFFIPSEKSVYIYELKAGSLRKKGKRYRKDNKDSENKNEITI